MARPVLAYLLLFLALMLVVNVSSAVTHGDGVADVHPMDGTAPYVPPEACNSKCTFRCSETSHKKPCMFFCNKCCTKCHCVPSGTYGHKDECPCYRDWRTKEGGPKCP